MTRSLRPVRELYGHTPAAEFGPVHWPRSGIAYSGPGGAGRSSTAGPAAPKQASVRPGKQSPVSLLTKIGLGHDLWHDSTERAYATVGRQSVPVRSRRFPLLLVKEYRKRTGGDTPNPNALSTALTAIEAKAVHDGPK